MHHTWNIREHSMNVPVRFPFAIYFLQTHLVKHLLWPFCKISSWIASVLCKYTLVRYMYFEMTEAIILENTFYFMSYAFQFIFLNYL